MNRHTVSSLTFQCREMSQSSMAAASAGNLDSKDVPVIANAKTVERRPQLSAVEFYTRYVRKRIPVVVTGAFSDSIPVGRWSFDYFRERAGDRLVSVKYGDLAELSSSDVVLSHYLDKVERYEANRAGDKAALGDWPGYLHDVPLVSILGGATSDLDDVPAGYFPSWYGSQWPKFAQFFLGPPGSLTPLHFDTLLTHNLFFQVAGRKRFILLAPEQAAYCYRKSWRWFAVDAEAPDYAVHPLYRKAEPLECIVGPGDMLYLPPGTLHQVRSLDCAISFNVDWHTRGSALRGVAAVLSGMPLKNLFYNSLLALGLCTGIPANRILPFYRSYLNYKS